MGPSWGRGFGQVIAMRHVNYTFKPPKIDNARKKDLHRWRETFAKKLREWGIEAEASSQATRGAKRRSKRVWERQSSAASRADQRPEQKSDSAYRETRLRSMKAWVEIAKALAASTDFTDRELSASIIAYVAQTPSVRSMQRERAQRGQQLLPGMDVMRDTRTVQPRSRMGTEIGR